jgi:hypothetical protein
VKHPPSLAVALLFFWGWASAFAQDARPAAALDSLDRHFAEQLKILAEKCDSLQLPDQARLTRTWQVKRRAGRHNLFVPPASDATVPPANSPDLMRRWHDKFQALRVDQANGLYDVALSFLKDGDASQAYQLLHETLRENPDHELARKALGYTRLKSGTGWSSYSKPIESGGGKTLHPKTGWQSGKYWRIDSSHWRIATNHSPAAGIDLAKKLEDFHLLWKQVFFDYWCTADDLKAAIATRAQPSGPKVPMNVYLFRNRDEYIKFLEPTRPQIGKTQGLYADDQQTAVFFVADESIQATWYHEAAHQLFQEWRNSPPGVGDKQNFWLVEGAALYVESLQNHGSHWTVGGWQADRLQIPRYRALSGDKGLPFEELVALGREGVQGHKDIGKLYSQFAARSHFLFDHADPAYHHAGNALLRKLYQHDDDIASLKKLTGASLDELDREFFQSLQVTDDDLLNTLGLSRLKNLSLGRTKVTDQGLTALSVCKDLRWLELCGLPITDEGLAHAKGSVKLTQLFLDGTKITAGSLPLITSFTELEELDLSNLTLDETTLPTLGKLRKLKILFLTGTKMSPATFARLKQVLPKTQIEQ